MDVFELKRRYEGMTDDEIMRLWADQDGLTEIARSVLAEEMKKRGLEGAQVEARVGELKQQLIANKARVERHQKRVVWKAAIYLALLGVSLVMALLRFLAK